MKIEEAKHDLNALDDFFQNERDCSPVCLGVAVNSLDAWNVLLDELINEKNRQKNINVVCGLNIAISRVRSKIRRIESEKEIGE